MLFSIVLPSYNRAEMLPLAIESVLRQDYENWELIIIDDGSTDNTKEVVSKYLAKHKNILYAYQENSERSAARNHGISLSSGEWICFLDSDDTFFESHLSYYRNLIQDNNNEKAMYVSGLSFEKFNDQNEMYNLSGKTNVEFVLYNTIGTVRVCVSKELLNENKFDLNIHIGEDTELWTRILKKHPVFYHSKKSVIVNDHENRSIYHSSSIFESINTYNKILKNCGLEDISQETRKYVRSKNEYIKACYWISKGNRLKATIKIFISIVRDLNSKSFKYRLNILLKLISFRSFKDIRSLVNG